VILLVSPYLVIKLTRYRVFRIGWSALVLYFERYGFEPELRDEYLYKFLVIFLTESRQILKYDLEIGNYHSSQTPSNRQTYNITRLNSGILYSTRNVVK